MRRFMVEKLNWANFRENYVKDRVPIPKALAVDTLDIKYQESARDQLEKPDNTVPTIIP
jgi:hypothetical protein